MDFTQKMVIETYNQDWIDSPMKGVRRIPLDREGVESGYTTSIVTYEAGCHFKAHAHPLGEEIFVIEGIFSDEFADYPAGTYLRNPPGSTHSPFSKNGCKILVKLNQFNKEDLQSVVINTSEDLWRPGQGRLSVLPLHSFGTTSTALVKWPAGEKFLRHAHYGGEEIYVLKGEFIDEHGRYPEGTWIRSPHLSVHCPYVEEETIILVKTGHLPS